MCGIAGYFGDYTERNLTKMVDLIAHRGPDDSGVWLDAHAGVGLGHRRLSIIDLSGAGHQPMIANKGSVVIVYNGEIYNHRELRSGLEGEFSFTGKSDTEVLLNLYLKHGADCLKFLNGIFAFAIWDRRNGKMLLSRDPIGVKPLYYAKTSKGFVFSSEIKSLMSLPDLSTEIDPGAVLSYTSFLYSPGEATMLKSVRKLEPGFAMELLSDGTPRTWRYYELPVSSVKSTVDDSEAIDMVRTGVEAAVRRQLVADVPVGAFLSGGLDSSAVVAMARRIRPVGSFSCFTIEWADKGHDGLAADLPYAERVARHLDVDLYKVRVGPEMAKKVPDMVYQLDEPEGDPAALNAFFICQLARAKGIKVLLSGAGGDDLFTGYRRHRALLAERYWAGLPKWTRRILKSSAMALPSGNNIGRRIRKAFQYADVDEVRRIATYLQWIEPNVIRECMSDEYRQLTVDTDVLLPMVETLGRLPIGTSRIDMMLALEMKYFLADHNLNYTDKMSMAVGVEARVPLLDLELVKLAFSLPSSVKQRGAEGKWVLKKAMEGILPHGVIYRSKTGFGVPLRSWLKGELRDFVHDFLGEATLRRRGIFDGRRVAELIRKNETGQVDATYSIFTILCIEIWCQRMLNN